MVTIMVFGKGGDDKEQILMVDSVSETQDEAERKAKAAIGSEKWLLSCHSQERVTTIQISAK